MSTLPLVAFMPTLLRFHRAFWRQRLSQGVQVPATNQMSVNLCPLVSLDASVRMSRCLGDGEMGV